MFLHSTPSIVPKQFTRATITRRQTIRCEATDTITNRKPRILCLHGFRTSGQILKIQLNKWPQSVLQNFDFFFPDAPFPSNGKSGVERVFDPPYYEWFQTNKDFKEYMNFDKCLEYIEECMINHAPIDGLLGFSQGAILSAALPGLQAKGIALTRVPKIGFLVIISGAKLKNEALAEKAYSSTIQCPSLHFLALNVIMISAKEQGMFQGSNSPIMGRFYRTYSTRTTHCSLGIFLKGTYPTWIKSCCGSTVHLGCKLIERKVF